MNKIKPYFFCGAQRDNYDFHSELPFYYKGNYVLTKFN